MRRPSQSYRLRGLDAPHGQVETAMREAEVRISNSELRMKNLASLPILNSQFGIRNSNFVVTGVECATTPAL
jgi:hypothetical protein